MKGLILRLNKLKKEAVLAKKELRKGRLAVLTLSKRDKKRKKQATYVFMILQGTII